MWVLATLATEHVWLSWHIQIISEEIWLYWNLFHGCNCHWTFQGLHLHFEFLVHYYLEIYMGIFHQRPIFPSLYIFFIFIFAFEVPLFLEILLPPTLHFFFPQNSLKTSKEIHELFHGSCTWFLKHLVCGLLSFCFDFAIGWKWRKLEASSWWDPTRTCHNNNKNLKKESI